MSYKPDEKDWMAYLYDELDNDEREKVEQYLLNHAEARKEFESFQHLRSMMGAVKDKEVIAPPIVLGDAMQRILWNAPYMKMIISIAASLLLLMVVGNLTDARVSLSGNEWKISFGEPRIIEAGPANQSMASLTPEQVQEMINSSLHQNNAVIQANWDDTQRKLDASIKSNLALNAGAVNQLVREASTASQDQIRQYVSGMQSENLQLVKDYFQLTSTDQKKYIENLLVDFAKYLQQQRNDDLQLVTMKLNSIEKNTDLFKQETEQILSSIITTVNNPSTNDNTRGTKY
ncbi:MAG: hypothetical protein JNM57_13705 [Cyclobacteriaceae bacterium]|nr:hypothetical protein [Cyclobacteriaceae bacterium]